MAQLPILTFAIPFYGTDVTALLYLGETIKSVLEQPDGLWEAVIVDDASPLKNVADFVSGFNHPLIRYHRNDRNMGQAGNWNECVKQVRTPYYTILHADDMLMTNYAKTMLAAFDRHPEATIVFCNAKIINEKGHETFSFVEFVKKMMFPLDREFTLEGDAGLAMLMRGDMIMCPTVCYRKDMTAGLEFSMEWQIIPDFYYWTLLLLNDRKLVGIPDTAFLYRRHHGSGTASRRKALRIFEDEDRLYALVAAESVKKNWATSAKVAEKRLMVKLRILHFAELDIMGLRLTAAYEKIKLLMRIGKNNRKNRSLAHTATH